MNVKDKTYRFTKMISPSGAPIFREVKEKELTEHDKNLLFEELINKFKESPKEIQMWFVKYIVSKLKLKGKNGIQKRTKSH